MRIISPWKKDKKPVKHYNLGCIIVSIRNQRYLEPWNIPELPEIVHYPGNDRGDGFNRIDLGRTIERLRKADSSPERSEESEKDGIIRALEQVDWNKAKAARILGISRATIYNKTSAYGIEKLD